MKRIIDIAAQFGEVRLIDAATRPCDFGEGHPGLTHRRVLLGDNWGVLRRHFTFWRAIAAELRHRHPDIVFAEDFFTTLPGWFATRRAATILVYDAHELIIPEPGVRMSPRDRFWYLLERFVVPRAQVVFAANPERARMMHEHYGLGTEPSYLRNIPTPPSVTEANRAAAREAYPALRRCGPDDRIILYQGNIALARGIGRFVEALDHLPDTVRLVVAGSGPDLQRLKDIAEHHTASGRFTALGRVPHEDLAAISECADIGVVTYPHSGLNNLYCAPNKIYEYAQAGLPVIATDQEPLRTMLGAHRIGLTVSRSAAPETVAARITELLDNHAEFTANHPAFLEESPFQAEHDRIVSYD